MKPLNVGDLADAKRNELSFETPVKGIDYENDITLDDLLDSFATTGFQATNLHKAIDEVKKMRKANAKIYFGCTSNMISSGIREVIKYLSKNKYIDIMVCTAGGIEEDLIKCFNHTFMASFSEDGKELRENGWNRIGNLVINNENYMQFETWFNAVLDELVSGADPEFSNEKPFSAENPLIITPSAFIRYLGRKINNESSVLYWCYKNNIKVFSPAITDGSIGDMFTFYSKRSCIKLDIVEDIHNINMECLGGHENGAIVIGCGLIKHHILNANLFNNGLDYCVLVNTANEFDGSDSGASLSEAYSWGKVKPERTCVKVHGDASIIFPLLVYGAFKSKNAML
ncbi:deoxyhypusine synthase [Enteropsectra breve]|nr:deoxyhypusine synthase [Enteropsectra breve]